MSVQKREKIACFGVPGSYSHELYTFRRHIQGCLTTSGRQDDHGYYYGTRTGSPV